MCLLKTKLVVCSKQVDGESRQLKYLGESCGNCNWPVIVNICRNLRFALYSLQTLGRYCAAFRLLAGIVQPSDSWPVLCSLQALGRYCAAFRLLAGIVQPSDSWLVLFSLQTLGRYCAAFRLLAGIVQPSDSWPVLCSLQTLG